LIRYYTNNVTRMHYDEYLRLGYGIGVLKRFRDGATRAWLMTQSGSSPTYGMLPGASRVTLAPWRRWHWTFRPKTAMLISVLTSVAGHRPADRWPKESIRRR
jgi:hypothetical protein